MRRSCQDARHQRVPELHLRIRHEDVQPREHGPRQRKGDEPYHELAQRRQQRIVFHVLQCCAHVDGQAARYDQQDGQQQQHRRVVCDATVHVARLLHLPDAVERDFHAVHQVEHRPEQQDESYADEHPALRL